MWQLCFHNVTAFRWVGNYLSPRATLGLYLCLAGQIHTKYANSKLKMEPSWAVCYPSFGTYAYVSFKDLSPRDK